MNNSLAEVHFLKPHPVYEHWYPVFAVMIGTTLNIYADVTKEMKAEAKELANSRKGYWRMAKVLNQIFSNKIIAKLGYTSMLDYYLVVYEN